MFPGFQRHDFSLGDVAIRCAVGGSGPPLLLLHGNPQTHAIWARCAPLLADRFTCVCPDLRGYGDSSKPRPLPDLSNYSFRAMAADQVALMGRLGFERFHVVGHDRGGRTAHRMALDHPDRVLSMGVLDIAPTRTTYGQMDRRVAAGMWMWNFFTQPAPLPERMIGADPDFFFETVLTGLGRKGLDQWDAGQLAEYRRCWRDPAMIAAMCSDYRAAVAVDLALDEADFAAGRKVACPALALWGEVGAPASYFDVAQAWGEWCPSLTCRTLPAGHFFIDSMPTETAQVLGDFLKAIA